jgi:hypothetical protein
MAIRYPLVLKEDNTIQEVQDGDTIFLYPISLPVVLRSGDILNISIPNGISVPVVRRDGATINILVQS